MSATMVPIGTGAVLPDGIGPDGIGPDGSASPLSEALRHVEMNGAFYCYSELTAPWGTELPAMDGHLFFHVVSSGRCLIDGGDGAALELRRGDMALLPHGRGHVMYSDPDAPQPHILDLPHEEFSDQYAELRHGGGGELSILLCGAVRFEHPAARRLMEALPDRLRLDGEQAAQTGWLTSTIDLLTREARQRRPGSDTVVTRLCDIVVIQAIRAWLDADDRAHNGWLGALRDERIGAAMTLIHRSPQTDWSVASLAAAVAMSRSAFAQRFTELVGVPVMRYVTDWRMQLALERLRTTDDTIASIARSVGYESDAAFSRAFTRHVGINPRAARGEPPVDIVSAVR